jgi:hypothetical protein
MEQPIIVNYRWTAEELIAARHYHFHTVCRPIYRWGISFIAVCSLLAAWGYYTQKGLSLGAFFFAFGGVYWLFFRGYDRRWAIRRSFRKRPDQDMAIEWAVTEDDYRVKSKESESRSTWKMISKVARTPKGFLVYPNATLFYWLPFHGLSDQGDIEKLEQIFRQHVPQYVMTK